MLLGVLLVAAAITQHIGWIIAALIYVVIDAALS